MLRTQKPFKIEVNRTGNDHVHVPETEFW